MQESTSFITVEHEGTTLSLGLRGEWVLHELYAIERWYKNFTAPAGVEQVVIDGDALTAFDTAGAWAVTQFLQMLQKNSRRVTVQGLHPHHEAMLTLIANIKLPKPTPPPAALGWRDLVMRIGRATVSAYHEVITLLTFIGETFVTLARAIRHPSRIRFSAIVRHIDETGIDAIPIVALIAFLISIVLAYQSVTQLKQFGAEIFTVDLVAISVLREMGVLLTAIMVAGRSGSAFTAEIGVMKVTEEVDAMRTLGMNPFELLVLPRLIALVITMPILTFIADMVGLLGAAAISLTILDLSWQAFVARLHDAIGMWTFGVGMIKAPFFAFLIAVVGCLNGLKVSGSAEKVGRYTTIAVVESIFLVILADAMFSILFSKLDI